MSRLVWWRGTWVQREDKVMQTKERETRVENMPNRRAGKEKRDIWRSKKKCVCSVLLSSDFLSLSLSCVWILFCLHLCPPSPSVSLVLYQLPAFFLLLSLPPRLLALCLRNESESLCRLCFLRHVGSGKTSGVPEHVLTTPTHCTSHSTFMRWKHTHEYTHFPTFTRTHSSTDVFAPAGLSPGL